MMECCDGRKKKPLMPLDYQIKPKQWKNPHLNQQSTTTVNLKPDKLTLTIQTKQRNIHGNRATTQKLKRA